MLISTDRDLPLLRADAAQLERVFVNLLENARRYCGGHPIKVRARVVGGALIVRIIDRGPGIAADDLPFVFEPFSREGGGAGTAAPGSGWRSSRGFVEANGGRARVESLPGQGTVFALDFPIEAAEPRGRRREHAPVDARARLRRRAADPARRCAIVLREAGYDGQRRDGARGARRRRDPRRPTPRSSTSCCPTATASRSAASCASWSQMPILVLSAIGDEAQKVQALEAGADDYVTKPFGPRELVARLQRRAAPRRQQQRRAGRSASDGLEIDLAARRSCAATAPTCT